MLIKSYSVKHNQYIIDWKKKHNEVYNNKQTVIKFILEDTYQAFANAIRRTLINEIDNVKGLVLDIGSIITTDAALIIYNLELLISSLRVSQSIDTDYEFYLLIENNTSRSKQVKVSDFNTKSGISLTKYVNELSICEIRPGTMLECKIIVKLNVGWRDEKYNLTNNIGFKELNNIKNSHLQDPTSYLYTIHTNGTIESKQLLLLCFNSLISRLENILKYENNIFYESSQNILTLIVYNESYTISQLLLDGILYYSKNKHNLKILVDIKQRQFKLMLKVNSKELGLEILNKNINLIIKDLTDLLDQVNKL